MRGVLVCMSVMVVCVAATLAGYPAWVPEELSQYPDGELLRGSDRVSDLSVGGDAAATPIDVDGEPFSRALRIAVAAAAEHPWSVHLRIRTGRAIARGDVLLLVFWARAQQGQRETGEGWISALFERGEPDWEKSLSVDVAPGPDWRRFVFPFTATHTFDSAASHWGFDFGAMEQSIELGGIELIWFGTSVTLEQLVPLQTRVSYSGREPDAPWRAEAAQRIERIRKADLSITVLDNGVPVENAAVHLRMQRHAFGFGSAVNAARVAQESEHTYREKLRHNFNCAVIENHLKWRYWGTSSEQIARAALDWLAGEGIAVRGHVLVWPGWRNMPEQVSREPQVLARQITDHIAHAVTLFRGELVDWDVINEPFDNHDVMDLLGNQVMVDWFHEARRADSTVRLYINDYHIVAGNSLAHRDHYEETIRYLLDNGAPLDGIGIQGHFGATPVPLNEVLRRLDRFAAFGLPIKITEFDINTRDEELQADYTRDFLTAVFSHASVDGFLMWGFWEGAHWLPLAAMYRMDWSEKPNLHAYRELVFGEWWTDERTTTASDGTAALRGFKGEYLVHVSVDTVSASYPVTLLDDMAIAIELSTGELSGTGHLRPVPGRGAMRLRMYPCSSGLLRVHVTAQGAWQLLVFDIAGRVLARREGHGPQYILLDAPPGSKGGAIARLHSGGGAVLAMSGKRSAAASP